MARRKRRGLKGMHCVRRGKGKGGRKVCRAYAKGPKKKGKRRRRRSR